MTWHPLTLAIWLLDGMTLLFYLWAAGRLLNILPGWEAAASDQNQLRRERGVELIALQGRWMLTLQTMALALLLFAISNVWPAYVPGAMCGLGVMQAMQANGGQTLFLRVAVLMVLFIWHALAAIDGQDPLHRVVQPTGRLLLLAGPLIAAATLTLGRALAAVRPDHPVSCCATAYAHAGLTVPSLDLSWNSVHWTMWCSLGTVAALVHGACLWFRQGPERPLPRILAAAPAFLWLPAAYLTIKFKTAPYLLEVLYHPCPFCLLLADHGPWGFALFAVLVWTGAEMIAGQAAWMAACRYPSIRSAALSRQTRAGRRIVTGTLLFVILAVLPAMIWRWRFGAWMN